MKIPALVKRVFDNWIVTLVFCLGFSLLMLNHRVLPINSLPFYSGNAGQDCYQMTWNLWETNEAISAGRNPYHTNLVYYPAGAQLGRHDLAPGFFPITFVVKLFSRGNPRYAVYSFRLAILLSFTLILFFSYLTLRELHFSRWSSVIAAVAYTFSHFYLEHFFHLSKIAGFVIPAFAFCCVQWFKQPGFTRLLLAAIVASYSFYLTEFAIYIFMALGLIIFFLLLSRQSRELISEKLHATGTKRVALSMILAALIALPFVFSFWTSHIVKPSVSEPSYYSANLAGFFIPLPQNAPVYGKLFGRFNSVFTGRMGEAFIGFPVLVLAVIGLIKSRGKLVWYAASSAALFFVLSLGPTLRLLNTDTGVPLPYALLMRIPPFDSGRTPVRFVVMGMFFFMIVTAAGVTWLQAKITRHGRSEWLVTILMSILLLWVVAERYSPISRAQSFAAPRGLERIVSGPVLNLPLIKNDGYAEALQIFHRQPIGTGYLSRYAPQQEQDFDQLQRLFNKGGATFCDGVKAKRFRNIVIAPLEVWPDTPVLAPLELTKCSLNIVDLRTGSLYSLNNADDETPRKGFPLYTFGARVDLTSPDSDQFLWYGWSKAEEGFRWTNRNQAAMLFNLARAEPAVIRIKLGAFLTAGRLEEQRVNVELNGHQIAKLEIKQADLSEYSFAMPVEFLRTGNILTLDLPDAESPAELSLSEDERVLGIKVQWIEIDAAK